MRQTTDESALEKLRCHSAGGAKKIYFVFFSGSQNPGVPGAPKCQQMQTSSQWRQTYVHEGETIWKPDFHIWAKMEKIYISRGLRGSSMIGLSCFPAIFSPVSMYMSNKETIWQEISKFKPKIWKKYTFFIFGGSCVALCRTQVNENFRAVRPHHRVGKQGKKTRLLGHPQLYPPVALNQYTLVNRTHKHFIYICFKAPQTS